MAVERRLTGFSGFRIDLPHIRSLESAVSKDFDNTLRGLVTGLQRPYLIRGFNIKVPQAAVSATTLSISVADSAVLHSSASESGTILTVPADEEDQVLDSANERVIGAFQNGAINYIALDYRRASDPESVDETAGWSPSQELEFQRTVPIGRALNYRFVITTNGFGNLMPLFVVKVDNFGNVEYITKAVNGLFRLGSGGSVPNPFNNYDFGGLENDQPGNDNPRREWINQNTSIVSNPTSVVPGDDPNAFLYGDWSISNLKDWMDAIMTRLKEITGSTFWYASGGLNLGESNLRDLWWDAVGSVLTGNGSLSFNYILEVGDVYYGALQTKLIDDSIISGDSYVEGADSGTKANLQSFSANQLLINSLTNELFTFDEDLNNRRIFRHISSLYQLSDANYNGDKYAVYQRQSNASSSTVNVNSFSFDNIGDLFSTLTITTDTPHGLKVGQVANLISFAGVTPGISNAHQVKEVVSDTVFKVDFYLPLSGTPDASSAQIQLDTRDTHPFLPKFEITDWSASGSQVTLTVPKHNLIVDQKNLDTTSGSNQATVSAGTDNLKPGMLIEASNVPVGTRIQSVDSATDITMTEDATSTSGALATFKDFILVYGLDGGTTGLPNGRWAIESISGNDVVIDVGSAPDGTEGAFDTPLFDAGYAAYDLFKTTGSISGADLTEYNFGNVAITIVSETSFKYIVGPDTLPNLGFASGNIVFDFVVAFSTVQDPIRVESISIVSDGVIEVKTFQDHELNNASVVDFTIYGNSGATSFVRQYQDVNINVIDSNTFRIENADLDVGDEPDYTNSGSDEVFLESPDNPYAGPIQWDSDLIQKGIIGDLSFRILQTATATGTPEANKFNTDGLTGTAFLQNGEVAYIHLVRNKLLAGGAFYTSSGGPILVGSTAPEYQDAFGNILTAESGDYVKFEDESESRWIKIDFVSGNNLHLISDDGQAPTSQQRPAKVGRLVISKGNFDEVLVAPHWKIDSTADIYWLAVRRDNGSLRSKVYLKSLELELGETRQINDNEPTAQLQYIGANSEGQKNPNYTLVDKNGAWKATENVEVLSKDTKTRQVSFAGSPNLGFQQGDQIKDGSNIFEIKDLLTNNTVVIDEDIAALTVGEVEYRRINYNLLDSDNLTLANRKQDREDARFNSILNRPVYDESFYVKLIEFTPDGGWPGVMKSGNYIYQGTDPNNPDWLAWVLHGSDTHNETIEGVSVTLPGDHPEVQPDNPSNEAALIVELSGTFNSGGNIFQDGNLLGTTAIAFTQPGFPEQSAGNGIKFVLPPNKRTQVVGGSGFVVWPAHSVYKASSNPDLSGEELMVVMNDSIREVEIDYRETFGGPKAIIEMLREMPPDTRIRCRALSTYGSILTRLTGAVTLQIAYDGGNAITTAVGRPVRIESPNAISGDSPLIVKGSLGIDGRGSGVNPPTVGGLLGQQLDGTVLDKAFFIGREDSRASNIFTAQRQLKTHDGYTGSEQTEFTASDVSTNDSARQVLESKIEIDEDYAYRIKAKVTARANTASTAVVGNAAFELNGLFYREAAGSAQQSDDIETLIVGSFGDGDAYAAELELVGDEVYLFVYGSPSGEVYWITTIEYQRVSLSS